MDATSQLTTDERIRRSWANQLPMALDLRAALYLFIVTIPADIFPVAKNYSVAQVFGIIFMIIIAVRGKWFMRMPETPFWAFICYYGMLAFSVGWMNPYFLPYWRERFMQLTQLLAFFWVCAILMEHKTIRDGTMAAYSYSSLCLVALARLGVPGFVPERAAELYKGRVQVGGNDPNGFTVVIGIALLYFLEMMFSYYQRNLKVQKKFLPVVIYLIIEIVIAGSRGGQLAVLGGLLVLLFTKKYNISRPRLIGYGLVLLVFYICLSYFDPFMSERWEETIKEGRMSGREDIFPASIEMIKRKPVLGYGPAEHLYVLGPMTAKEWRDPHNSFIWTIHETGLVGGLPYLLGFLMCGWRAFRKNKKVGDNLPLALWTIVFIASNDVTMLYTKTAWLVLAIAASRIKGHH